jgi:hypothetical protein
MVDAHVFIFVLISSLLCESIIGRRAQVTFILYHLSQALVAKNLVEARTSCSVH